MPVIMIVSAFAALVSSGGAPRASIFMGRNDKKSAEKTLGNCFSLQIIVSAVLTAVLLIWNRPFLMAFGASENTIKYALPYMNIYAAGTLFVQLTLGMNAFVTAQGLAKTGMLSVLIGAVSNIILDPLFIFTFDLGVRGAALATVISQGFSCIWILAFLYGKRTFLKIRKENLRLERKIILPALALGTAAFMMQASESVIFVCFNSSLQKYGGDMAVGAMTILQSIMQFAMLPLMGVGQGAQPILSYNYGAGNKARVKKAFRILLTVDLCYSMIFGTLVMLFSGGFAAIFTSNQELIDYTVPELRIFMGGVFIFGIQMACQMAFTSFGKAKDSIVVAVVRKFVLLLPLIYVLPHIFTENKARAVYMAEPIADVIAVTFTAILFIIRFRGVLREMDAQRAVGKPAAESIENAAENGTENDTENSAESSAEDTADKAAENSAENTADNAAENNAENDTGNSTQNSTENKQ